MGGMGRGGKGREAIGLRGRTISTRYSVVYTPSVATLLQLINYPMFDNFFLMAILVTLLFKPPLPLLFRSSSSTPCSTTFSSWPSSPMR